jgi:hypothetical protein
MIPKPRDPKDEEIQLLRARVMELQQRLQQQSVATASSNAAAANGGNARLHHLPKQPTPQKTTMVPYALTVNSQSDISRQRIGRNASIATRNALNSSKASPSGEWSVTQRILAMFQAPTKHVDYLNSEQFAKDILRLCRAVKGTLEGQPRCVFVQSPVYVFGDIHGNLEDLHFFADHIWKLGMQCTAGNFLFLGDYVDRGLSCLETVSYLLAVKHQLPNKVWLLRGNHETRDVNGWEEHYQDRSFIWQCQNRFGEAIGYKVWESVNAVFDRLPLAAVIDQDIFCVHGGIPRAVSSAQSRLQDILNVPAVAGINPPYQHEPEQYQQVASDCIWSDPATAQQEVSSVDPVTGYGESLRGGGAICFGHKAVTDFLAKESLSYILRAHEAHADGVAVSKGARVFTVFSTSKDHNQGRSAKAGCILVDDAQLQVINRSPAYRNQYVHRRDSESLRKLPESEIRKRMQIGLVTPAESPSGAHPPVQQDWQDIEDDDDEDDVEDYVLDPNRRPSVDMDSMSNRNLMQGMANDNSNGSKHPATISEEDDEVATVDGDGMMDTSNA